jgi:uncharacterized protein (DUF2252 family)
MTAVADTPARPVKRPPRQPHATPEERAARGRAARAETPRSSHAVWEPPAGRQDPIAILSEQDARRVPELVPIRHGRMLASPFAFYRGAAAIMAADLAGTPRSGLQAQLCGDAHLSNFGGFASPERDLVFDINDFDETLAGPWEWDVKRLAASMVIGSRDLGIKRGPSRAIVEATVRSYREAMREFATMANLAVWYSRRTAESIRAQFGDRVNARQRRQFDKRTARAQTKDSTRALARLTHDIGGEPRIAGDPPLIVPISDLLPEAEKEQLEEGIRDLLRSYRAALRPDRRRMLEGFRYVDLAHKVVGVGSVGTRAWIVLLLGRDNGDPLFLQVKEAGPSVLEGHSGSTWRGNQGRRVVEGQWLMQAASDIFLGWLRTTGLDGRERDFYVRQLWDWKVSAEVETMAPDALKVYGELCAWSLARAHACSGDRIAIAAYLGSGDRFDKALADFSEAYADQNERDYAALQDAVRTGALSAETGL